MFTSPTDIAFHLGPLIIKWYGVTMALAFISGIAITSYAAKKENIDSSKIIDLSIYLIIGGILGARLYFVLFNYNYYKDNILEIFQLWHGGLSIHGGIIAGLISGWFYTKLNKLNFLKYADIFSYGIIFAQSIGRWGNFFNSEAFGGPTNLPWKLFIPFDKRPLGYEGYQFFHPTFLYESIWNLFIFIILFFFLEKKLKNKTGGIFFSYLIFYSLGRFFIEGLRIDSIFYVFGVPIAQIASFMTIITGIVGLYFVTAKKKEAGQ